MMTNSASQPATAAVRPWVDIGARDVNLQQVRDEMDGLSGPRPVQEFASRSSAPTQSPSGGCNRDCEVLPCLPRTVPLAHRDGVLDARDRKHRLCIALHSAYVVATRYLIAACSRSAGSGIVVLPSL
jgi:hypothetical protein